jgi:hypothetical protein
MFAERMVFVEPSAKMVSTIFSQHFFQNKLTTVSPVSMDEMRCQICRCAIAFYGHRHPAAPAYNPLLPTRCGAISAAAQTLLVKNNPPVN